MRPKPWPSVMFPDQGGSGINTGKHKTIDITKAAVCKESGCPPFTYWFLKGDNTVTTEQMNQVMAAIDGFHVGYATVYPKDTQAERYVFDMTPENISGFLNKWKEQAGKILLTDMLDRPILEVEHGDITQSRSPELKEQVLSLLSAIQEGRTEPARFPIVSRELYDESVDMEEQMVARAEVAALEAEERQMDAEMGFHMQ